MITWRDESQGIGGATGDASSWAVKAQVFAADGSPIGSEILVNTATENYQIGPEITTLPNGDFVITWTDSSQGIGGATGDSDGRAVKAQIFKVNDGVVIPSWQISQDASAVTEADGTINFTITRSDDQLGIEETVYVSTTEDQGSSNENDYTNLLSQPFTFAVGEASKVVPVNILLDGITETDETFGLIVQANPTDPISTVLASTTFTIQDSPPLLGTDGKDILDGTAGNDLIRGGDGKDVINGLAGDDQLFGDDGKDILIGGLGNDHLTGGNGKDIFVVAAGDGTDVITDFKQGSDSIGLIGDLTFGGNVSSQISNGETLVSSNDEILVRLVGEYTLTENDFVPLLVG